MMPIAWTRLHRNDAAAQNKVFCTTMGAATDLQSEGLRRLTRALSPCLAATTADRRHVLAIATHRHPTLATCRPGFVRVEFVRGALRVRGSAALAGDLLLLLLVHARETARALSRAVRAGTTAVAARIRGGHRNVRATSRLADHIALALTIGPD